MSDCNCRRDDYLPTPPPCPDIPLPPPRPLPPMNGCRPCPPPQDCSNHTPNYGLPLWKASDVTSWLMQMNGAMLRIDTIMHDLALRTGINGLPDDLVSSVSKLIQDMGQVQCQIGELSNKAANNELLMQNINTSFSAMKTDLASVQLSLTNFDTRLMTVDSANQGNKNDITLIKTDLNMLSSTVNALQKNFQQYQQATNQTLSTLQTSVTELTDSVEPLVADVEEIKKGFNPGFIRMAITQEDIEILSGDGSVNGDKLQIKNWREDGFCIIRNDGLIVTQPPRFELEAKEGETVTDIGWLWIKIKNVTEYGNEHNWSVPTYFGGLCFTEPDMNIRADICYITREGERMMTMHINFTGISPEKSTMTGITGSVLCINKEA